MRPEANAYQKKKYHTGQTGFSIIETLIALSIFGIAFMAFTSGIWSASKSSRTTFFADESIFAGQEMIEMLSVVDIREVLPISQEDPVSKGNQKIIYEVIDSHDSDGNGVPDFKTIAISVYHSDDNALTPNKLRVKNYYRRHTY